MAWRSSIISEKISGFFQIVYIKGDVFDFHGKPPFRREVSVLQIDNYNLLIRL